MSWSLQSPWNKSLGVKECLIAWHRIPQKEWKRGRKGGIVVWSENGDLVLGWEWRVKETMNWRYCCRAGVMSRDEGGEEEELLIWTVFLHLKAFFLLRVTVVREGMSVCEGRVIGSTLQSDETRRVECITVIPFSSEWCEFRQVYSSLHFIIITSHDQFSRSIKRVKLECILTQLNGRQLRQIYSILPFSSHSLSITRWWHQQNAPRPNRSDFKLGMSIHNYIATIILISSNEAYRKLPLSSFNSPISITSKEGTFSISHTE